MLTMLGGIVGLVSGVGLAFAREYFSDSFTTEDNVRHQLGVPVLTSIPDDRNNRIEKVANGTNGKNGHNGHGKNGH
jgi:capsular polysaccharide biosynthesis protein